MEPTGKAARRTPICHRTLSPIRAGEFSMAAVCCGSKCALWLRFEYPVFRVDGADERVISPGTGRCADNSQGEPWTDPALAPEAQANTEPKEP